MKVSTHTTVQRKTLVNISSHGGLMRLDLLFNSRKDAAELLKALKKAVK